MFKIGHLYLLSCGKRLEMTDFSLDFACPVCEAQPKEKCTLNTGAPRFESHVERKWIAQDHRRKLEITKPPPEEQ